MTLDQLKSAFINYQEPTLIDRYIPLASIEPLMKNFSDLIKVKVIGSSGQNRPIYSFKIGNGEKKILMWSQMHGNESTTTKAIFDLMNCLSNDKLFVNELLSKCTLIILPMLNPDGAEVYTRTNANGVDLNRDAQDLTQPESKVLNTIFKEFKPDFCFNLHGQRTIFSAGKNPKSAIVSFLSPAQDQDRTITSNRKRAMEVISVVNRTLQNEIPNQVGVYDDSFNINCVGDTFQSHNVPTILFEAGHFPADYYRNITRKYIFYSLLVAIEYIAKTDISGSDYESYLSIPSNEKLFMDVIIRNADSSEDVGVMYQEVLKGDRIHFIPKIETIGNLTTHFGHSEINAKGLKVFSVKNKGLKVGDEIDFVTIGNEKYSLMIEKY